ncbi:hypothetical protein [Pseudomonas fulva]|uniref:Uncharacterized protein n=1 Tax=Pseudomonas fulva (strain 12-X) TaxID=743720 RepID=F6AFE8_PSEF1|nr:hypothetical protein [Pseudomonas fulva]AEF21409.1 hypothetical protein Psefu_1433 [Pseudomonas fulva 12-X]
MIYLILTLASNDLLRAALIHGGSVILKLARPGDSSQAIRVHIDAECSEHRIRLRATLADITGELTLDPHEAGFFNQAKLFIEDLANGRLDTGIPRPESEPAHSPTATLGTDDERTLRTVCRQGGSTTLTTGTIVNVHPGSFEGTPLHTGIAVHGARTHLVSGSPQDVYLSLAEHIQQLAA